MLTADTVVYLSITDSVRQINSKISKTPHNLNGYNLAFIFVVPVDYDNGIDDGVPPSSMYYQYFMDIGNQNITFSNFFNGTLFVFGDFLHDTYITDSFGNVEPNFHKFIPKTKQEILDPVKYDGVNPTKYIKKLYKEIDNPESIVNIINYEGVEETVSKQDLNKIKIKGTALNGEYSLITFSDVTAKTYVKNLSFESTLDAYDNVIDINHELNSELPTEDKIFLEYPLVTDGFPIIGDAFIEYLQTMSNEVFFNRLKPCIDDIDRALSTLSGIMYSEGFVVNVDDFANFKVSDGFISVLKSQLDQLNTILPNLSDTWVEIDMGDTSVQLLSTSIINEMKKFNVSEVGIPSDILSQNDITTLINSFESSFEKIKTIQKTKPSVNFNDYILKATGLFRTDDFIDETKTYISNLEDFKSSLSSSFGLGSFGIFLSYRPDLVSNEFSSYTDNEAYDTFMENYNVYQWLDTIVSGISILQLGIIDEIAKNNFDTLSSNFELKPVQIGTNVKYSHVESLERSSDDYLDSNYSDGSVDALDLSYDPLIGSYGYLKLAKSNYSPQLGQLMFLPHNWGNVKQKFQGHLSEFLPMFDSQCDTTLTFWTKYRYSTDIDQIAFISFTSGSDVFRFSIKPYSYNSISKNENPKLDSTDDLYGSIDSSDLRESNDPKNRNAWVMWSIKFDVTTRTLSGYMGETNGSYKKPDFRNLIGLNVTTYSFAKDESSKKYDRYIIEKHNMNQVEMDERTLSNFDNTILESFKDANYVWEPFSPLSGSSQFDNFSINIGFSKEPNPNGENSYFYNGYIRNLTLFKGHLTTAEEEAMFKLGILNNYEWPDEYEFDELKKLINSGKFFFGLVSIYDSNNINIINCNTKYNGNTYVID